VGWQKDLHQLVTVWHHTVAAYQTAQGVEDATDILSDEQAVNISWILHMMTRLSWRQPASAAVGRAGSMRSEHWAVFIEA